MDKGRWWERLTVLGHHWTASPPPPSKESWGAQPDTEEDGEHEHEGIRQGTCEERIWFL